MCSPKYALTFVILTTSIIVSHAFECTVCEAGTFCYNESSQACPTFSHSTAGSDDITDCACNTGYYADPTHPNVCLDCPVGHFCLGHNDKSACPVNTISEMNSGQSTDCLCNAGYYQHVHDGECIECPAGSYKEEIGFQACTVCPVHTFNTGTAATSSQACEHCPAHSSSSFVLQQLENRNENTDCRCANGYEQVQAGHTYSCTPCLPGLHDARSLDANASGCIACAEGSFSSASAAYTCTACDAHQTTDGIGKTLLSDCVCTASHYLLDGVCVACSAGTFQAHINQTACETCPVNTFSTDAASVCSSCHSSSVASAGSTAVTDCICDVGSELFIESGTRVCVGCDPGFFKQEQGNHACTGCSSGSYAQDTGMTACIDCPANTYSYNDDVQNSGLNSCFACPEHASSTTGASFAQECVCVEGYEYAPDTADGTSLPAYFSGECLPCRKGHFKNSTHAQMQTHESDRCYACPAGTSSSTTGSTTQDSCESCSANHYIDGHNHCLPCPANSVSQIRSLGLSSCLCTYGFEALNAGVVGFECVACAAGKYKSEVGNEACTLCPPGQSAVTEPPGIVMFGHTWIDPLGVTLAGSCAQCAANTYSSNQTCTACPSNSVAEAGSASILNCSCMPGYTVFADVCAECQAGFHKAGTGNHACEACPPNTFSVISSRDHCEACPAHSSTSGDTKDSVEQCLCDAGFSGSAGGPCTKCAVGLFAAGGLAQCTSCGPKHYLPLTSMGTHDACRPCPVNSTVQQLPGSGVASCVCDAGFMRVNNVTCSPCLQDTYCPAQHVAQACPHRSHAPTGSYSIRSCVCAAGFFGANGTCASCPVDSYCAAAVTEPAVCGANSTTKSLVQRTNRTACVCLPGFYANAADTCVLCEPDSYCASELMISCPANASAPAGATSLLQCVCAGGMQLLSNTEGNHMQCVACAKDRVCHARYTDAVEVCAQNASNVNQECQCHAGHYCVSSQFSNSTASCSDQVRGSAACKLCPSASYCAHNLHYNCPAFETVAPGAHVASACRCMEGFYRYAGVCTPCEVDHYCTNETITSVKTFDVNLRTRRAMYVGTAYEHLCQDGKCTHAIAEAVCDTGMFRTSLLDMCKPCPQNFYCPVEELIQLPNVVRCSENEVTLHTSSSSNSECICLAGFKLSSESQISKCLPCEAGELCSAGFLLQQCHASQMVPNYDHTECVCDIGFGWYSLQCLACPAGSVKAETGSTPCTFCGIDEYAINETTCMPCPDGSMATPGSTQCVCRPPHTWNVDAGTCVLCADDHYWTPDACFVCPDLSTSVPTSGMTSPDLAGIQSCHCQAGHIGTPQNVTGNFQCIACAANTYEVHGVCVVCGTNAFSPQASSHAEACICNVSQCHKQHLDGSCAGECRAPPADCSACDAGYFKAELSTPGNTDECSICVPGKYQDRPASTRCKQCPSFSNNIENGAVNISSCQCDPGFQRKQNADGSSACVPCVVGTFKNYLGDEACTSCALGAYNAQLNSTVCKFCSDATADLPSFEAALQAEDSDLTNSSHPILQSNDTMTEGTSSVLGCLCPRGHEPVSVDMLSFCSPCVTGTYLEVPSHDQCDLCGINDHYILQHKYGSPEQVAASSHSHCQACPLNSGQAVTAVNRESLMNEFEDCKCFPGYENRSLDRCSACDERHLYMIQPEYSDESCRFCDDGYYYVASNLLCQQCSLPVSEPFANEKHTGFVLNSVDASKYAWGKSEHDCVCDLGYERINDECHQCQVGYHRSDPNTRLCHPCPADTYQDATGMLQCENCPSNSSTRNMSAAIDASACICDVGYQVLVHSDFTHGRQCQQCPAGTYRNDTFLQACLPCPEDNYCPLGSVQPTACPEHELSDLGSQAIIDCECPIGRGRVTGEACELCPLATFASERHNAACTLCPGNKNTSSIGSTLLSQCKCVPGHGISGANVHGNAQCIACTTGYFSTGGHNIECEHCGWGAVTEPENKAYHADSCLCDARIGVYEL